MSIVNWLRRRTSRPPVHERRDLDEIVERMTALNPRLRLVSGYQKKLSPQAGVALDYVGKVVADLPAAREGNRAAWATDPCIRAFFATAEDVETTISRSTDLRAFFDSAPLAEEAYAVLGMAMSERQTLGTALENGVMRSDVPLTTISFGDHQVRICAGTEADLRQEILRRALDQLAVQGIAKIAGKLSRRDVLKREIVLLKTRLRLLETQGKGMSSVVGGGSAPDPGELSKLNAQIQENDDELARLAVTTGTLDRQLDILGGVIADAKSHLRVKSRRMRLTRMNVLLPPDATGEGDVIDVASARIPGDPPMVRAFALIRFPRSGLLPAANLLDMAERFL
ncbi:hypothetical protein [Cupriavidus sp. RAF12]|uniref:hypothetical protein n=1 Tax=Cupriavidus sp. RAF12 TaxID=3233050 RepID=UPI003F8E3E97